jgi:hypothetical protein
VTGAAYERFRRDYAPAFLQYLSQRGEPGRRTAYELGRRAITEQLSVLDLARIHHAMLLEVLKTHRSPQELEHVAQAAAALPSCCRPPGPTSSSVARPTRTGNGGRRWSRPRAY